MLTVAFSAPEGETVDAPEDVDEGPGYASGEDDQSPPPSLVALLGFQLSVNRLAVTRGDDPNPTCTWLVVFRRRVADTTAATPDQSSVLNLTRDRKLSPDQ